MQGKIEEKRETTVYNQNSRMREETASGLRSGVEKRASERARGRKRKREGDRDREWKRERA